jgi:hypothetical protein
MNMKTEFGNSAGGLDPREEKESVKLVKNTKGYQWECKVIIKDGDDNGALDRLRKLDFDLQQQWGGVIDD